MNMFVKLILLVTALAALAGPVAYLQFELLFPGVSSDDPLGSYDAWNKAHFLHADRAGRWLLLALIPAFYYSLFRIAMKSFWRVAIAIAALGVVSILLAAILIEAAPDRLVATTVDKAGATILIGASVGLILVTSGYLLSVLVFVVPAIGTWLLGYALIIYLSEIGLIGEDTWLVSAVSHSFGLSMLLSSLAILGASAALAGRAQSLTMNLILMTGVCVSGLWMIFENFRLGVNGMPRRYMDYPVEFADSHFSAGLAGYVLLAIFFAGAIYFVFLGRRLPHIEEQF